MRGLWVLASLLVPLSLQGLGAQGLLALTEEWPPFNYTVQGDLTGLGTEITRAVLREAGLAATFESLPWDRAYARSLKEPNILIFTMGRNAQREALFKWVGKIAPREIAVFKLRSRTDIAATSIEDMRRHVTGVGVMEDGLTQFLVARGFEPGKNLDLTYSDRLLEARVKKLVAGRVDLLPAEQYSFYEQLRASGLESGLFERLFVLSGQDDPGYYLALSLPSPDALHTALVAAYSRLEARGTIQKIRERYLK